MANRMKRLRHSIVGLVLLALAASSMSWTLPTTITVVDEDGAPASDAYVRYHYDGNVLNFVHPITYTGRGSVITRADAHGRLHIPFQIHFRWPLPLSTPPELRIDHIVVPRLHNTFGLLPKGATSDVVRIEGPPDRITVLDVSGEPELWARSLRNLQYCIRSTLKGPIVDPEQTTAHLRELIAHLRRDYQALLDAHGQRRRSRPEPPQGQSEAERQEWAKRVDAQIAREPLWGPYLERMWRGELEALDQLGRTLE